MSKYIPQNLSGAHYGLRDWLAQRVTAALMALFVLLVLVQIIVLQGPLTYDYWAGIFAPGWMKGLTTVVWLSWFWHAWVGVRDIWMDYVKPVALRLVCHVFTLVWLLACLTWALRVLWSL